MSMPDSSIDEPSDGTFRLMPDHDSPASNLSALPSDDLSGWRARLIEAGVKPNRVTSPDLTRQLERTSTVKADTLICSILDTDPSVPFNAAVAAAFTNELTAGLDLLIRLTNPLRAWVTADPDKPAEWFQNVQSHINRNGLRLVPLRGDYPQTDPTLMLYTLLQRRLAPGRLPTDKGVVLVDAAAAVAVGRCVLTGSMIGRTPLAIRDHFQQTTHFLNVPMNVRLSDVMHFLNIRHFETVCRAGDFLRDAWITPDTTLGNGELVVHATARNLNANPDPCIRCGWCLEACPTRIHPAGLLGAAQCNDFKSARRYGLDGCIECGICSYVCPTRLPLLTAIQGLKRQTNT